MEGISQQDLEQVAFIYDQIKGALRSKEISTSKALSDDLENKVTETMSEISSKICEDLSPGILELQILNSRYHFFTFCAEKFSLLEDETSSIWNQIFFKIDKVFQQVFKTSIGYAEQLEKALKDLSIQKKETEDVLLAAEELEKTASVLNI